MRKPGKMIREVVANAMRKPATVAYPFVKITMAQRFRGKLAFDAAKCIGCKMCMRDCPSSAINIRNVGDKQFEADIDLARCIYCAQCVDSCPKDALESTGNFELAQLNREKLKEVFRRDPAAVALATAAAAATAEPAPQDPVEPKKG
jgi:formate hydrogenlyase subunit 6/NADH:ubiquinone oxidoreductase subunit I